MDPSQSVIGAAFGGPRAAEPDVDSAELLRALMAVRNGDFSVRLASDRSGIAGKIADTFNEIVSAKQSLAMELERVGDVVGKRGQTRHRVQCERRSGAWGAMETSVNGLIDDLLQPTIEVTQSIAAVAKGDLSQTVPLEIEGRPLEGEFLRSARIVNRMIEQMNVFTSEVTRVAREVGSEGMLGGQAVVEDVSGAWRTLTDSVNSMAGNLTAQVRNIAEVTIAVANGDLSRKITVDVRGEILQLKEAINTMVDQLRSFASEVTRVAREVGTEGRLGGQAIVPGVAGTWKDLTDNVNVMAANLTSQVRGIAEVATAIARGDLSRKITVDTKGEVLELKNTINTMVDQLNSFASEVTRVAREVGTEGKLGGQAIVPGVAGTWKNLTDNVNSMAGNLTAQVRNIAEVATAVARGDLSSKITVDVKGEISELKNTLNTMVDQLNSFASEVTRVAREVGTEGQLGGQAIVPGVDGTWKDLTDNVNVDGREPHDAGAQHRGGHDRDRARRPVSQDHGRRQRRDPRSQEHDQYRRRPAELVRVRGHARRARGRHRGRAWRPSSRARRRGHVEGFDRQRERHGREPHEPGARHRQGRDRGRERRPRAEAHVRGEGRGRGARGHDQRHDRHARDVRGPGHDGRARGRRGRPARRPGERAGRRGHLEGPHGEREPARCEPHDAGTRNRGRRDGRHEGRPHSLHPSRREGRGRRPQELLERDDR